MADRRLLVKILRNDGGRLTYHAQMRVDVVPHDLCMLDSTIYVHGIRGTDRTTVHRYALDGTPLGSFGETYDSPNWLVVDQLSKGPMACGAEAGILVTVSWRLPLVKAYHPDGRTAWSVWLDDFTPQHITERTVRGQPAVTFGTRRPYDAIVALFPAGAGGLMLQTVSLDSASVADRIAPTVARTFVLDARTGRGGWIGDHPLLMAGSPPRFHGGPSDPFPQVVTWIAGPSSRTAASGAVPSLPSGAVR